VFQSYPKLLLTPTGYGKCLYSDYRRRQKKREVSPATTFLLNYIRIIKYIVFKNVHIQTDSDNT